MPVSSWILPALFSAGSTALGYFSARQASGSAAAAQAGVNQQNLQIAREQMAFQKEMYQNRHQYEVEDLRRAGLNPILSAGGQPPVPSGSQATMISPQKDAIPYGLASARLIADLTKMHSERRLLDAEAASRETQLKIDKQDMKAYTQKHVGTVYSNIRAAMRAGIGGIIGGAGALFSARNLSRAFSGARRYRGYSR